jgi:CHAT domain-containing protein
VHLAIPGVLDLADPERSRLLLGGATEERASGILAPVDLRGFQLEADLLMLSATAVTGGGLSPHDGRVPLVGALLDAGAGAVLYSLWPAGEDAAADFADSLYERLQADPDIVRAFRDAREAKIDENGATNLGAWASFQLFIR